MRRGGSAGRCPSGGAGRRATAQAGRPRRMSSMKEVRFPRAPTSMKTRKPSSWSASIVSRKRTGLVQCSTSSSRIAAGSSGTGRRTCTTTAATRRRRPAAARRSRGGPRRTARTAACGPRGRRGALADERPRRSRSRWPARPPSASPTRTTWWGQLSIARNSSPPASPAIRSAPSASRPSASSTAFGTSWRWVGVGVGGVQPVAERRQPLVGLDVQRTGGHRRRVLAAAVAERSRRIGGTSRLITA